STRMRFPSTTTLSASGSTLVPSSVTTRPFTRTLPSVISFSQCLLEATPPCARKRCSRIASAMVLVAARRLARLVAARGLRRGRLVGRDRARRRLGLLARAVDQRGDLGQLLVERLLGQIGAPERRRHRLLVDDRAGLRLRLERRHLRLVLLRQLVEL